MEALRFRPILVTFLLILLYRSGSLFVTSLSFICISIVATFICFIFKIQLDFEYFFTLVGRLQNFLAQQYNCGASRTARGSKEKSLQQKPTTIGTFRDLPRPIARKLKVMIDGVMNEFVESWYIQICPEDREFVEETRRALEQIAVEGYKKLCNVDTHSAAVSLINLLTSHLKIFSDCRDAVNSKYPGINATDFERCVTELYEIRISQHISSKSQGLAVDFLRKITDILLFVLLPKNAFSCEGGRFMLREILAIQGLQQLVDLLSDPHFVNKALVDIFEESVPKKVILEQWKEELEKELFSDNELENSKEIDNRPDSDVYESATEGRKAEDVKKEIKVSKRAKHSSYSSVEQINEISDNMESKFATPRHSTTEWSSGDESYQAFDRVLRQNQLEAKSSAPVYGSTMVKLHEQTDSYQIQSESHHLPREKLLNGEAKEPVKIRSFSAEILPKPDDLQVPKFEGEKTEQVYKRSRKKQSRKSVTIKEEDMQSRVISIKEDDVNEPWNECPPSDSKYYGKISYKEMNRNQDLLREQVKAKIHAIGSNVAPSACFTSLMNRKSLKRHESLPNITGSFEGSMAISIPENHAIYGEAPVPENKDITLQKEDDKSSGHDEEEFIKVHCVPERNVFYEVAPDCPTCIEMTTLANPSENGKAVLTVDPKSPPAETVEHECGLAVGHFYHPEINIDDLIDNEFDTESFISCDSDSLTDLEDSINSVASESTLLASSESAGNWESGNETVLHNIEKLKLKINNKKSSIDSFDIVSLKGSDSEFSSANDFEASGATQCASDSKNALTQLDQDMDRLARAPSITTFASALDSSTHEASVSQQFKTPLTTHVKSGFTKQFKAHSISKKPKIKNPEVPTKILKSLKQLRLRRFVARQELIQSSDDEQDEMLSDKIRKIHHHPPQERRKNTFLEKLKFPSKQDKGKDDDKSQTARNGEEFISSFSGTTDSDQGHFLQLPETPSISLPAEGILNEWQKDALEAKGNIIEEVADEVNEDFESSDCFKDAKSIFEDRFDDSMSIAVDSVDLEDGSNLGDDISVVHMAETEQKTETDGVIPIYQGEVILPHPSKMPVSAWMYPVQMVSIPSTEVAFEKGWEPGGNKYTLYCIHYDIRIWPEIYKTQMIEASQKHSSDGDSKDGIPIIREIKRRYREFMYLHNRLTHSQMSVKMKGVLRPNRRYGMPFGRMDPDVIEGRRKILEAYLVSLVSRQEVCNSREFKEFLGAEGYGMVSFIRPKVVQPKQMVNKMIGSIKGAFPGSKDVVEKGESSQYFIHGYDVPRMFGYSENNTLVRHSSPWFSSFVDVYKHRDMLPEGRSAEQKKMNVMGKVEFFQRPKLIGADFQEMTNRDTLNSSFDSLGPRSSGDGADNPEPSRNDLFRESPDRRFSVGIASLFTNELAARSRSETLSTLDARKVSEDIPWPLSDAVMSFLCQGLKGYDCWLTYENVQQALLYSLGGLLEWQISRAIDEIVIEERWMKYLNDLYHVIWEDGKLKEPLPDPTEEEKKRVKEEALQKMLDFIPGIVRVIIGTDEYRKWGEGLLHALQYQRINRLLLYAAIDLIMGEFIPELQTGYADYSASASSSK